MLKKFKQNWLTLAIVAIVVIKFGPSIMAFLEDKSPSLAKMLKPNESNSTTDETIEP